MIFTDKPNRVPVLKTDNFKVIIVPDLMNFFVDKAFLLCGETDEKARKNMKDMLLDGDKILYVTG